jgi:para-nitrobenzyl esterase
MKRPATELTEIESGPTISRRACLAGAVTWVGAGAALASGVANSTESAAAPEGSVLIASRDKAVVSTHAGRVRGYIRNGIYTFKGLPYAESTAGANRFMPPATLNPWVGIRSCLSYGPVSPQPPQLDWQNDEANFLVPQDNGVQDEDCLRVNVWTSALGGQAKHPVMVFLHGGRFTTGSSQHLLAYDGENLARRGEVVVVSLNHRLGAFGFMDLSHVDERYADSGNAGMLDIVAALQWVRDNIAAFGGDAARVTIFGHSGGAGKVATLLAMPSAQGLFHRAIAQSGPLLKVRVPEGAQRMAEETLKELDVERSRLAALQPMPYAQIVAAGAKVMARSSGPIFSPDLSRSEDTVGWAPVYDGKVVVQQPFDPKAPLISAQVPMLIGTTLNEAGTNIGRPDGEAMSEAELLDRVKKQVGDRADHVVAVFRRRTPQASRFDLWSRIASAPIRGAAIEQCRGKAALGDASVWLYWFTWQTPVLDGRPRAFHGSELSFVFNNPERCDSITGGGPEAIQLAQLMSDTWAQFAHTGDPNREGQATWPAFTAAGGSTMVFDAHSRAQNAPDRDEQAALSPG